MNQQSDETQLLLQRAGSGNRQAVEKLLERYRERLRCMIELRMSPALRGRIDASDILQDSYMEAMRRLDGYLRNPTMPFFLWLRFLARQQIYAMHRHHAGVEARDIQREVALFEGVVPEASTGALASHLLGQLTTPSEALARAELQTRLQEGLDALEPQEREILALRHFEKLSTGEAARELGISEAASAKRHLRALKRLKGILLNLGFREEDFR